MRKQIRERSITHRATVAYMILSVLAQSVAGIVKGLAVTRLPVDTWIRYPQK